MERRIFEKKNTILVTKMTISSHGGISKKNLHSLCTYGKWNFKPKISSEFHSNRVNDG